MDINSESKSSLIESTVSNIPQCDSKESNLSNKPQFDRNESTFSNIPQFDGNDSICSNIPQFDGNDSVCLSISQISINDQTTNTASHIVQNNIIDPSNTSHLQLNRSMDTMGSSIIPVHISDVSQEELNRSIDTMGPSSIPVHISDRILNVPSSPRNKVLRPIKKSDKALAAVNLPTVANINPRSVYNKITEFHDMVEQYEVDLVLMSESWERENLSLKDIIHWKTLKLLQMSYRGKRPGENLP